MSRATFRRCRACGDYHWTDNWPANHVEPRPERSALPSPMLHRDQMAPLWHPHDGRHYESKAEFRAVTKASGGIEMGNDVQRDTRTNAAVTRDEVGQAIQMVNQGYKPGITETAAEGWS
jgi:hypothetical protein